MDEVFIALKRDFENELETEGDYWRILRVSTIIDLIKLNFFYFQKENNKKYLFEIFKNSIKVMILSKIGSIRLTGNIQTDFSKFNSDQKSLTEAFDSIFFEIQAKFDGKANYTQYDLHNQVQYIKVINQLELENYTEEIFEEIVWMSYCVLKNMD